MTFTVKIKVTKGGRPVANGTLHYETTTASQKGRRLSDDLLDHSGVAQTSWHGDWLNETVDVYCHTNGNTYGKPEFLDRIVLKPNASYNLWPG